MSLCSAYYRHRDSVPACPCAVLTTGTGTVCLHVLVQCLLQAQLETACLYVLVKCLLQTQGQRACMSLCSAYYRHRDSVPAGPCAVLTTGTGTACLHVLVQCLLQAQGQRACRSLCSAYYRHRDSVPVCPCAVLTTGTGTACLYCQVLVKQIWFTFHQNPLTKINDQKIFQPIFIVNSLLYKFKAIIIHIYNTGS